jgi:Recombination directionality factor-like
LPIIGLTDRTPSFPRIGVLRKGAPKVSEKQPGKDLGDHFRLDTEHADVVEAFVRLYGEKPNHIRCILMHASAGENFSAWKEHHSAGALKRRCDGQTCIQRLCSDGRYDFAPTTCVCLTELAGSESKHLCRPVGRLTIIIPELERLGYVLVPTTSIHDIIELQSNLDMAEALRGDLRGIPFILRRQPRKVSMPGEDGKRVRREKWLLSLEPAPDWVRLQIGVMQRQALPGTVAQLPGPQPAQLVDATTGEILDDDDSDALTFPDPPLRQPPTPVSEPADDRFVTIEGAINGAVTRWQASDEDRVGFRIGEDRIVCTGMLAANCFDLEETDVVRIRGVRKVDTKGLPYIESTYVQTVLAPNAMDALS